MTFTILQALVKHISKIEKNKYVEESRYNIYIDISFLALPVIFCKINIICIFIHILILKSQPTFKKKYF